MIREEKLQVIKAVLDEAVRQTPSAKHFKNFESEDVHFYNETK